MNEFKQISNRLKKIATYINENSLFADIGSDHAYLPSYICSNDSTVNAIAGEVSRGPFERAKETVSENKLTERIDVRLGNGLAVVDETDKLDAIVIAGMGGGLISTILKEGKDKLPNVARIIAQPNTNGYVVRKTMQNLSYKIVDEAIIEENDHIYEIIIADKQSSIPSKLDDKTLLFGPVLWERKCDIFKKKWTLEHKKITYVLEQMDKSENKDDDKIMSYKQTLQWIEEVIS